MLAGKRSSPSPSSNLIWIHPRGFRQEEFLTKLPDIRSVELLLTLIPNSNYPGCARKEEF